VFVMDHLSELAQLAVDAPLERERSGVVVQCLQTLRGFPCQGRLGAP